MGVVGTSQVGQVAEINSAAPERRLILFEIEAFKPTDEIHSSRPRAVGMFASVAPTVARVAEVRHGSGRARLRFNLRPLRFPKPIVTHSVFCGRCSLILKKNFWRSRVFQAHVMAPHQGPPACPCTPVVHFELVERFQLIRSACQSCDPLHCCSVRAAH